MRALALSLLTLMSAATVTTIELRSGEIIAADGVVEQQGSRTVFRVGTRAFSLASEEIVSLEVHEAVPTAAPEPALPRTEAIHVSAVPPRTSTLNVDRQTAERVLNAIQPATEGTGRDQRALPAPVTFPPPSPDEPDPGDEHYWRERWRQAQDGVADARQDLEWLRARERRLNDEILSLIALGYHESQMGRQAWQLQNTRDEIERAALRIQRAERELTRVRNDARREGAPPAWLRE